MTNLAPILYSADDPRNGGVAETINADAAPSLNAAFEQIHAESGIKPIVLHPYGGGRTEAQQAHLVSIGKSDTMNSDHREDFEGRAAADIDNQHQLRAWNEARFLQIMADHGWHNMTTSGKPFPTEAWHFAVHGISPAAINTQPLTEEDDDMSSSTGISVFKNKESGEVTIAAPWLVSEGNKSPNVLDAADPVNRQFGYVVTTNPVLGLARQRLYGRGSGYNELPRPDYIAMQEAAQITRTEFLAAKARGEI